MVDVAGTLDSVVDSTVEALPTEYQATARDLVDATGNGLSGAWDTVVNVKDNLAERMEPALGETGANIASIATMAIGGLLTYKLGSGLTNMFTSSALGDGVMSGLANTAGGLAMVVGIGALAMNYMNGTGPFEQQTQTADVSADPRLGMNGLG